LICVDVLLQDTFVRAKRWVQELQRQGKVISLKPSAKYV
jgi:GTPase SAR1 family protein